MPKNKRIKSKTIKSKLDPIPHNNRAKKNGSRLVKEQIILVKDKENPNQVIRKTIFHMNLSPFEQQRIHMIKVAVDNKDPEVLTKLNHRERMLYDKMLKENLKSDEQGKNDN